MSPGAAAVVVVGLLVAAVVIVKMLTTDRAPRAADSDTNADDGPTETRTERLHESVDRPAGPAAEPMTPERLGGDQSAPFTD